MEEEGALQRASLAEQGKAIGQSVDCESTAADRYFVLGVGGHASVVVAAHGAGVAGWVVRPGTQPTNPRHIEETELLDLPGRTYLLNGIGFVGGQNSRQRAFDRLQAKGLKFAGVTDKAAMIAEKVKLAESCQILMGAKLNVGSTVGRNTIVNTGAILEHHATVGEHSHLAPGSVVCGNATVGDSVLIGAGAIVLQGLEVASGVTVGAGAVVTESLLLAGVYVGSPARRVKTDWTVPR